MANLGTHYIQVVPTTKGISSTLSSAMSGAGSSGVSSFSSAFSGGIGKLGKILAGAFAVKKFVEFGTECAKAYNEQFQQEVKLETIMKKRMKATDKEIQGIKDYASVLQESGVVGDEVALAGAQQVGTFLKQSDSIKKLLPAMENLAVQQNGVNVSASTMQSYGNLFGKVMQGQTGALKRVGISFTDAQEKVLKYGTEEEKASMLAKVVSENVGDMNKAIANTPEGKVQQLKNHFGDLKELIGKYISPVIGNISSVLDKGLSVILNTFNSKEKNPIGKLGDSMLKNAPQLGEKFGQALLYLAKVLIKYTPVILKNGLMLTLKLGASLIVGLRSALGTIGNVLVSPFKSAGQKIKTFFSTLIKEIKAKFKFKLKLGNFKLPHIAISWEKLKGWKQAVIEKIGFKGIPDFGIKWYASGGVFNHPTIAGIGEAGAEAVVPLDQFWNKLENVGGGNLNLTIELDGGVIAKSTVNYINGQTIRYGMSPLNV